MIPLREPSVPETNGTPSAAKNRAEKALHALASLTEVVDEKKREQVLALRARLAALLAEQKTD